MSRDNVVTFSKAVNTDVQLASRLRAGGLSLDEWVKIAREAGFEFTSEEFMAVVGATSGRTVSSENAVREFLNLQPLPESSELSDASLESIVGGAARFTVTVAGPRWTIG